MPRFNPFAHHAAPVGMPRQAAQAPHQDTTPTTSPTAAILLLLAKAAFHPASTADYTASDPARVLLADALPAELFAALERGDRVAPEALDRAARVAGL